jgi:hydrogenase nickel incorporation protein HypB
MCGTCGCGDDAKVTITNLETGAKETRESSARTAQRAASEPAHAHSHDHPHSHDHGQGHEHPHGAHSHDHDHHHGDPGRDRAHPEAAALAARHGVSIDLERAILAKNDAIADRNRAWFDGREILALNLVSSPGAGKTSLLERTIRDLGAEMPMFVIEGDQQTLRRFRSIPERGVISRRIWCVGGSTRCGRPLARSS